MKNAINVPLVRLFGLAALCAVMGFTLAGCGNNGGDDHTHLWGEWTVEKAATCTAKGIGSRVCTICDATDPNTSIPVDPNAHDWSGWIETTEPTLITEGEETRTCQNNRAQVETRDSPSLPIDTTAKWDEAINLLKLKDEGKYTLTIDGDIGVDGVSSPNFGTTGAGKSLSVTLKGSGTLSLASAGSLFNIGARQTLIIDSKNLTLQGLSNNNAALVTVDSGTLELKNGTISGNTNTLNGNGDGGGGVRVNNGTFTMNGGEISGNAARGDGGGVYVYSGTFSIVTGTIYGSENTLAPALKNIATDGAAILKRDGATARYGSDTTWTDLPTMNEKTIKVIGGVLQP
jgi:hypothetical protein